MTQKPLYRSLDANLALLEEMLAVPTIFIPSA